MSNANKYLQEIIFCYDNYKINNKNGDLKKDIWFLTIYGVVI